MTTTAPTAKGTFVYLVSPDGRRTVRSWVKISIGDVWLPLSGGDPCHWGSISKQVESLKDKGLQLDIEEPASAHELNEARAIIEEMKKTPEGTDG